MGRGIVTVGKTGAEIDSLLEGWRTAMLATGRSRRTVDAYLSDVRILIGQPEASNEHLSWILLQDLSRERLRTLADLRRSAGDRPATLARRFAALRALARYLIVGEGMQLEIAATFVPVGADDVGAVSKQQIPSDCEAESLQVNMARLSDDPWIACRDMAILALMAACGLRLEEITRLNAGASLPPGSLLVAGRDGATRRLALPSRVTEVLEDYRAACPYPLRADGPLFLGMRGGRLHPAVVQRQMRRLRQQLGLSSAVTPSGLRRWFAQILLSRGHDWANLRDRLGYARITTVRRAMTPPCSAPVSRFDPTER